MHAGVRSAGPATIGRRRLELDRCGMWLMFRPPKENLEQLDSEPLVRDLQPRGTFRGQAEGSGLY